MRQIQIEKVLIQVILLYRITGNKHNPVCFTYLKRQSVKVEAAWLASIKEKTKRECSKKGRKWTIEETDLGQREWKTGIVDFKCSLKESSTKKTMF